MAARIVDSGFRLPLWACAPASLEPYARTAPTLASTTAELGAASDVVGVCVVPDSDLDEVLLRSDGVLAGMAPRHVPAFGRGRQGPGGRRAPTIVGLVDAALAKLSAPA